MSTALLLSLLLARSKKPPPPPSVPAIDATSYAIDLELDTKTGAFTTRTLLKFTVPSDTSEVQLDSHGLEITSATMGEGGAKVEASLQKQLSGDDVLDLKLPTPITANAEATLELKAKGMAVEGGDLGLLKRTDPDDATRTIYYAMFEPTGARRIFPCHDVPDDKATFQIAVTTDASLKVLSNGTQVSDTPVEGSDPARHKVTWKLDKPNAPYSIAMVVGAFERATHDGTPPLALWVGKDESERAKGALDATAKNAAFLADFLETPFPYDHYDQVAIPAFLEGGMEDTTLTLIRANLALGDVPKSKIDRNGRLSVIAHELAHQWTGDDVTFKTWGDLWLSESLATYLGQEAEADASHTDSTWIRSALTRRVAYFREEEGPRSHAIAQVVSNPLDAFDAINYQKGAAVLRMLENYVGREPMRKGLKSYLDNHAYGNASTDDFFADMEKATGKPLKDFAQAWVHEQGYPIIKVGTTWLSSAKQLAISVSQKPSHGSHTSFAGTLIAVAHRSADPSYDRVIPLPMSNKPDIIGVDLPDQPEWINWNQGNAFLARFEHNIPVPQLQAEAMKDTDPTARLWALLELAGPLADPEKKGSANPAALSTLADAVRNDHSPYVRAALMKEMARSEVRALPSPIDDAVFAEANSPLGLGDDAPGIAEVRAAALALLGKVSMPAADKLLTTQIKDADLSYDLLQGTIQGIATHGNAAALRAALTTHGGRGPAYRRAVLAGIATSGTDESGPLLLEEAKKARANSEDARTILGHLTVNTMLLKSAAGTALAEGIASDEGFNEELRARAIKLLDPARSSTAKAALGRLAKLPNAHLAALAAQGQKGH